MFFALYRFLLFYYFIALPRLYACSIAPLFFMSPIADAFVPKIIPPSMAVSNFLSLIFLGGFLFAVKQWEYNFPCLRFAFFCQNNNFFTLIVKRQKIHEKIVDCYSYFLNKLKNRFAFSSRCSFVSDESKKVILPSASLSVSRLS